MMPIINYVLQAQLISNQIDQKSISLIQLKSLDLVLGKFSIDQILSEMLYINQIIKQNHQMRTNEKNNRSLFAIAGEKSLGQNLSLMNATKIQPSKQQPIIKDNKQKQRDNATRKLMMKLTLPRLRKMQALVRGFLVRRKIYPPKLQKYLVAKSILNLVISNVLYRQSSEIILQSITYLKYEPDRIQTLVGNEKILESQVCNRILQRVFHKEIKMIVELAVAQYAKLLTRPKITYGFNLRDPLELLLYDTINNFVIMNYKEVVREAIQQCVDEKRQIRVIDEWIDQFNMLQGLYQEIVNEALNQSIGQYIVSNMLDKINLQGAQVLARVCFDEEIQQRKQKSYNQIQQKMVQWILQEASLKSIVSLGYSFNK